MAEKQIHLYLGAPFALHEQHSLIKKALSLEEGTLTFSTYAAIAESNDSIDVREDALTFSSIIVPRVGRGPRA